MELTRAHFKNKNLAVMDQIALLVFMYEHAISMGGTFKNSNETEIKEATPDAKIIIQYLQVTSVSLLDAIFHNDKNTRKKLNVAYQAAHLNINKAISAALRLSEQEKFATDGKGNIFSSVIILNLENLEIAFLKYLSNE